MLKKREVDPLGGVSRSASKITVLVCYHISLFGAGSCRPQWLELRTGSGSFGENSSGPSSQWFEYISCQERKINVIFLHFSRKGKDGN